MGSLHVVTGADHLSAVATLACGNSRTQAFWLGVRWGSGHSVGLIVVFLTVLTLEKQVDEAFMGAVGWWMGVIVGCLMVVLGAYGMTDGLGGVYLKEESEGSSGRGSDGEGLAQANKVDVPFSNYGSNRAINNEGVGAVGGSGAVAGGAAAGGGGGAVAGGAAAGGGGVGGGGGVHAGAEGLRSGGDDDECDDERGVSMTRALLAVVVGVIHGAAGPGAVLGVLPAVALRDTQLVLGYFTGFIFATVFAMGIFAAAYGELTYVLGKGGGAGVKRWLMVVSSTACMVVGVGWIYFTVSGVRVD